MRCCVSLRPDLRPGHLALTLVAVALTVSSAFAQDRPQEWAAFEPQQVAPARTGPVLPHQWALITEPAAFASPMLTRAERAWIESARDARWADVLSTLKSGDVRPGARDERGTSVLVLAARAGQDELLRELLKRGAPTEGRADDGFTALGAAAHAGQTGAVRQLLKAGADPLAWGATGLAPLHLASMTGHVAVIDQLLKAGVPVDLPARDGPRPLQIAAFHGQQAAMVRLIAGGARMDAADEQGRTPLRAAAVGRQVAAIDWLIAQGARADDAITQALIEQARRPLPAALN